MEAYLIHVALPNHYDFDSNSYFTVMMTCKICLIIYVHQEIVFKYGPNSPLQSHLPGIKLGTERIVMVFFRLQSAFGMGSNKRYCLIITLPCPHLRSTFMGLLDQVFYWVVLTLLPFVSFKTACSPQNLDEK